VHYVEDRALYGAPPADLGEDDFARAWVETWARYLGAPAAPPAPGSGQLEQGGGHAVDVGGGEEGVDR